MRARSIYVNGNYMVSSDFFGNTRRFSTLRIGEDFMPDFPDSVDLKITNKCSNNCPYCHESSNISGKSFNYEDTKKMLEGLPNKEIEIAIGGGNIFECFDDFKKLLFFCVRSRNFYTRATFNVRDLLDIDKYDKVGELVRDNYLGALGVSIETWEQFIKFKEVFLQSNIFFRSNRLVFHIVIGIFPLDRLKDFIKYCEISGFGVLILGFKTFGRGINFKLKNSIDDWKKELSKLLFNERIIKDENEHFLLIGFDNLAIDQISLKDMILKSEWDKYYLGQDFSHTMYIDAVDKYYAPTSRSPYSDRVSWDSYNSVVDYFKNNHNSWN